MKIQMMLSAACVLATTGSVSAATFSVTDFGGSGIDLTIVEVEGFFEGGAVGNTVNEDNPSAFWALTGSTTTDNLYNERTVSAFAAGYEGLAGATDRTYETNQAERQDGTVAKLVTTVSGLTAGNYEVFLVYISGAASPGSLDVAGTLANLNGSASTGTFYTLANADATINGASTSWSTSIASLGTTGDGATDFTVGIGAPASLGRTHALAVGYRVVPEPGSLALLGVGGLAMFRRRRHV